MDKKRWKILAIIFIILFILETWAFVSLIIIGNDVIDKENNCAYNVCGLGNNESTYDAYYYDSVASMCYCYQNNILSKQRYIS